MSAVGAPGQVQDGQNVAFDGVVQGDDRLAQERGEHPHQIPVLVETRDDR
ncbi:hypothetical protein ABZY16_07860 [Streptomyces sp. NPDC006553]